MGASNGEGGCRCKSFLCSMCSFCTMIGHWFRSILTVLSIVTIWHYGSSGNLEKVRVSIYPHFLALFGKAAKSCWTWGLAPHTLKTGAHNFTLNREPQNNVEFSFEQWSLAIKTCLLKVNLFSVIMSRHHVLFFNFLATVFNEVFFFFSLS